MGKEKRKLTKAEWFFGVTELVGCIGGYKIGRNIANQAGVNNVYSVLFGMAVGVMTTEFLDKPFKHGRVVSDAFKNALKERDHEKDSSDS